MTDLFSLSPFQMSRIKPFFPGSHGVSRVYDRRVISGIVYVLKHGLQWKDAPPGCGPNKTLYNRLRRWPIWAYSTGFSVTWRPKTGHLTRR